MNDILLYSLPKKSEASNLWYLLSSSQRNDPQLNQTKQSLKVLELQKPIL